MVVQQVREWTFSATEHATTISPDRDAVYAFDLEGRPVSWWEHGKTYKRSLAGGVYGRERVAGRRRLWETDPEDGEQRIAAVLERLRGAPTSAVDETLRGRLEQIRAWTPKRLRDERRRFDRVYQPVSILPPDQYLSIVLQATFGCTWNRCTFCSFYQDRPFSARSIESFREHVDGVCHFLGRGAGLRRRIFLADGNALILPNARLLPMLDIAQEALPGRPLSGFVDVFTGDRKPVDDWNELGRRGLERVYVGLETGDDSLLHWLNKPGSREASLDFVRTVKEAGLSIGVIIMVGVGGNRFADVHVRHSVALVASLPLTRGDIVYLSPFVEHSESEYASRARHEGVRPLDEQECEAQYATLRDAVREAHAEARVARYDIREFLY